MQDTVLDYLNFSRHVLHLPKILLVFEYFVLMFVLTLTIHVAHVLHQDQDDLVNIPHQYQHFLRILE